MKTKDFIKMLQKEDPTGEGHLRFYGGVPIFAECKPGYWDGSYNYIDEEGNYVTSTMGYKVDIHQLNLEDFVTHTMEDYGDECTWEEIESKFKFDIGNHHEQKQKEKRDSVLKAAKKTI